MIAIDELPEEPTTRQVLRYLDITEKVLRGLRDEGYIEPLPYNRLFKKAWVLRYRKADVEALRKFGRDQTPKYREASKAKAS
jgi:hypothetical protein